MITDNQIEDAWENADFGEVNKRDFLNQTMLKYVCGYESGHTTFCICQDLELVKRNSKGKIIITKFGREYTYWAFSTKEKDA